MKFLVLGASGQLGSEFALRLGNSCVALSSRECDVTNLKAVLEAVETFRPTVILNCAAYNLVDSAESDFVSAFKVNGLGVRNVAHAAGRFGAFVVHFSTDYVFNGKKEEDPYTENDPPDPVNVYGRSKLFGEELLREELPHRHLIFRVSWLYGRGRQNFVWKLLNWAGERPYLKVACDEFSVPTSTRTVVDYTLLALKKGLTGLFHLVNTGFTSRFEWAREALKTLGLKKFVRPAYMAEFNLPAKRPGFSPMSNGKLSGELSVEIPHWLEELRSFLPVAFNR
ncbi:dTDP-4-dehydrorhamnose reductase [Thermovibrio ammonificans]